MGQLVSDAAALQSSPKLLLFDLDGTLVRRDHTVDQRVQAALNQLSQSGVHIGIASGRASFGARHLYQSLSINAPSMFFSGSLVEDPINHRPIFLEPLDQKNILDLASLAREKHIYTELYSADDYLIEQAGVLTDLHAEYLGKHPIVGNFAAWSASNAILKLVLIADSRESEHEVRSIATRFSQLNCGLSFGAAHPELLFANFTAPKAERLLALESILARLNISRQQVASFGDAESDLPLLTNCGYGFALANAPKHVKERAPMIADDVEADGVLPALRYLFPQVLKAI